MSDLRFAFRQLLKNPGFTAVAALTLALGIGANTAIFSVVNAVLLKPLPYAAPQQLVWLSERGPSFPSLSIAYPNFQDWQWQQTAFEKLGAYKSGSFNLTGEGDPLRVEASFMTSGAFGALGVKPVLGRFFTQDDDKIGAAPTVVLSHALWQSRFGKRTDILNQTITLDQESHTIVGVMPPGFAFPASVDLWMSMGALVGTARLHYQERGYHSGFFGVARLKEGTSLARARSVMDTVASRLGQQYPEDQHLGVRVDSLLDTYVSDFRSSLWTLLGAVGLVLLIASSNVANLLLGRAAARQKEMALRAALGAGRWRILRQLSTESLVLVVVGGAFGLLLARIGIPVMLAIGNGRIPRAAGARLDGSVLAFTALVAGITGVFFGLIPVLCASRDSLHGALKSGGRGTTGSGNRLRNGLVVAEVAVSLVLLIGAGLLLASFQLLQRTNPGFVHESVLSFRFDLPEQRYATEEQRCLFYQGLVEKLRLIPGVEAASVTSRIPLDPTDSWQSPFLIEGEPAPIPSELPNVELSAVSPDYFRTLGIPIIEGRPFTELDDRGHLQGRESNFADPGERWIAGLSKLIIDKDFARRYWPNASPIGRKVRLPWRPDGPVLEVVGVVGRVKLERLSEPGRFVQGYVSFLEAPRRGEAIVLRTSAPPETLIAPVRRAVLALDADQPLYAIRTLAEIREASIAPQRINLLLLGVFAGLAVVLAMIGLYGVLAYSVTQRRREIGVRIALGAERGDVFKLVLRQGMLLTLLGILIGLASSLTLTRVLASLLYQIKPTDPITFGTVCLLLSTIAVLACLIPACRAVKVDPIEALRYE